MTWLIVAYMTIWIAIFIYVFNVDRKQKAMASDLEQLKNRLSK
jgi:CcmD family protein